MREKSGETPFWRQTLGVRVLCTALFLVGLAAFAIATMLDVDYWVSVARSDLAKWEYGGGSVVFRSVSFLFAAVVAYQWRKGGVSGVVMGVFAGIVLLSFASIGMSSVLGFGARERIVPYEQAKADAAFTQKQFERAQARQEKLEDAAIAQQKQDKARMFAFLEKQASRTKYVRSKQAAYDAMGQAALTAPSFKTEVVAAPQIDVPHDPQAEAIASFLALFGWTVTIAAIQLATTAAFGIGLIIAEMVCMGFAVAMWPKAPEPREIVRTEAEPDGGTVLKATEAAAGGVPASAEIIHPPQFQQPATATAEDSQQSELFHDIDEHLTQREGVEQFWEEATRPAAAARIGATTMYHAYRAWCEKQARPLEPVTQRKFGMISGTLVDKDDSSNKGWFYLGRALVHESAAGEAELLMVA